MNINVSRAVIGLSSFVAFTSGLWAEDPTPGPRGPGNPASGALETRNMDGTINAPDGVLMVRGAMMYLKKGKLTRVSNELKLKEGLIVRPSGEVTLPGGKSVVLQEGQMMGLDGQVTTAPKGLGSTAPGSASSTIPQTGNLTDFGNSGVSGAQKK